jgi:transposase-like protein
LLEEGIENGALREELRTAIREALMDVAAEELAAALGAERYQRTGERQGYRHGTVTRHITTQSGRITLELPRARVGCPEGGTAEWTPTVVPRYQRRMADVDKAILRCYLGGVNTRKVSAVLRPLLEAHALSKSAVSRLTGRPQSRLAQWRERSLAAERLVALYLDGFHVKVRHGKRLDAVPVLAAVGVRDTGERVLLLLTLGGNESTDSWRACVEQLIGRGLKAPKLVVIDGHKGLRRALCELWPRTPAQRCTVHKWQNLKGACPTRLHEELHADYRGVV